MLDIDPPAAAVFPPAASSRVLPAHKLFLTTILLILTLGTAAQYWRAWEGLIFTELVCILWPAWFFARRTGSAAEALRLKWVGIGPCALGFGIGAGLLPLAGAAGLLAKEVLGYSFQLPDRFLPVGILGTATYLAGMALAAPLCEEMVFRGYILGAYERAGWRPRTAILAVAGLFTAWHLSPIRWPTVAVLALALTYVALRTGSVWPSVAAHMGANGTAAVLGLVYGDRGPEDLTLRLLLPVGVSATAMAILCLWRISIRQAPAPAERSDSPRGQWWPLWVTGAIVLAAGGVEVVSHRLTPPTVESLVRVKAPWTGPVHLNYEIYDKDGRAGDAEYRITPGADAIALNATLHFRGPNDLTQAAGEVRIETQWDRGSMMVRKFVGHQGRPGDTSRYEYSESGPPDRTPGFGRGFYSPGELPWRLSAATWIERRSGRPVSVKLREATLSRASAAEPREMRLQVDPKIETIRTRAGTFRTVRIAAGPDNSMWYDMAAPHTLVQYRTAGSTWILTARQ